MNASSAVASAFVFCSLAAVPASAMVVNSHIVTGAPLISNADFVQGHEAIAGIPARQAALRAKSVALAQSYYDVDMIVTIGALALASGAFVAVGLAGARRRKAVKAVAVQPREGWREGVMQALEVDLMQFSMGLRQAA